MTNEQLKNMLEYLKSKGVDNPEEPNSDDMSIVLSLLFNKELTTEQLKVYLNGVEPGILQIMDGLKSCVESNKNVSTKVIEVIKGTIDLYDDQIKRAESLDERKEIRDRIEKLIYQITEESEKQRKSNRDILLIGSGIGLAVVGLGLAAIKKDPELLQKGIQLIVKGAGKAN